MSGITTRTGIWLGAASRSSRFLGAMIDGSFAGAPLMCATFISRFSSGLGHSLTIAGTVWAFFYFFFSDGLHEGQSFAQQWLGMRVVDEDTGAPCTLGDSFIRNIFRCFGLIDLIPIFGERRQRLGDKAAGTIVVVAD